MKGPDKSRIMFSYTSVASFRRDSEPRGIQIGEKAGADVPVEPRYRHWMPEGLFQHFHSTAGILLGEKEKEKEGGGGSCGIGLSTKVFGLTLEAGGYDLSVLLA